MLYHEGGEREEQVDQSDRGCSISGNVQDQIGWYFEQPGVMENVLAHSKGN